MKDSTMADSKALADAAWKACENSYSPYSHYKVGAALRVSGDDGVEQVITACNVENSSYGASVCAERSAAFKAISIIGPSMKILEVAVATDVNPPWPPCGICRQVVNEFVATDIKVHLVNSKGIQKTFNFRELLPHSHNRDAL